MDIKRLHLIHWSLLRPLHYDFEPKKNLENFSKKHCPMFSSQVWYQKTPYELLNVFEVTIIKHWNLLKNSIQNFKNETSQSLLSGDHALSSWSCVDCMLPSPQSEFDQSKCLSKMTLNSHTPRNFFVWIFCLIWHVKVQWVANWFLSIVAFHNNITAHRIEVIWSSNFVILNEFNWYSVWACTVTVKSNLNYPN